MTELRAGMPPLPDQMRTLHIDERGYPVPWFVKWYNGKPDFRIVDNERFIQAVRHNRCFICGNPLGRFKTFVGGPMAVLQMVSAEPPTHHACAEFAVRVCPFLVLPRAKRRRSNMPGDASSEIGESGDWFVEENPGISGVWTCTDYYISKSGRTFNFRDCARLQFFVAGREATAEEITVALHRARDQIQAIQQEQSPS